MIVRLCLQAVLFAVAAFFSGSETALFSLSRLDLQKLRRERHPQSETLHRLLDEPRRLIISILCGNETAHIAATINLAGILVELYGVERAGLINVLIMFPLMLLLGEVTPKTIAVSNPVRFSSGLVAAPLSTWVRLVTPLREAIRVVADRITTWIVGEDRTKENILQKDEFRTVLEEVAEEGILDATERILIDNLMEASDTEIVEIMTPRTRVQYLDAKKPVAQLIAEFRAIRHPRVPVFRKHRDNLIGFVHAEDVLRLVLDGADLSAIKLKQILHPPVVVPPTKTVDEMFDFFQSHNARAAAVLNEFGGIDGFITMRDVINFIFGEISEGVHGQELYQERDGNVFEVDGAMKLTAFDDLTNFGIEDPRMTTIGGVVFRHLDRLPKVGDRVEFDGFVATVLAMDGHRVARLRVTRGDLGEEDEAQAPSADGAPVVEVPSEEAPPVAEVPPAEPAPDAETAEDALPPAPAEDEPGAAPAPQKIATGGA
ncbi:MAG: DUF21 domain-containing protein [Hyphomicrobiales bacterium]|nr:DUF21 domain-containing protein [Hyphomicrobiales bacterium]